MQAEAHHHRQEEQRVGGKSARVWRAPPPPPLPLLRLRVVGVQRLAVAMALPAAVDRQEDAQHPREEAEGPDLLISNDTPPGTAATARHHWKGAGGVGSTLVQLNPHALLFVASRCSGGCTRFQKIYTFLVGKRNPTPDDIMYASNHPRRDLWGGGCITKTAKKTLPGLCAPLPPRRLPTGVPTW